MVKAIRKGETLKSAKGVPAPSQQDNNGYNPNAIHLSLRFIIGTMLCVSVVAFAVGRLSAILLLRQPDGITTTSRVSTTTDPSRPPRTGILPPPPPPFYLAAPNEIPQTVHGNSKHFRTDALFAVSDARRANPVAAGLVSQQPVNLDGTLSGDNNDDDSYDQQHKTSACQHLLVDIKSAEAAFLNSEDRLGRAMIDLAQLSNLTILNYHCHGREVSMLHCVSVLLEPAHIVLRSWWPIADGISLDLFTCGPKKSSLLSLLPDIERFFGAPQKWFLVSGGDVTDESSVQWAHKKRGFRTEGGNPEDVDLQQYVLGWLEFDTKTLVVSVETKFQTVEIYDVINPRFNSLKSYKKSLSNDGSYEARYPELFRPDRVVYLDGIMQSRRYGDAAYHEALVHPAMISHPKPQRVAIIGGGEGATLREVLKHNTVETVTMIEIDEIMVNVSREHLPEWSDCSMLVGSTPSCFDDQRVEVNFTDAIAWFIERFLDKDKVNESDLYDVIIMDALDPTSVADFSDALYDDAGLARSLFNALTKEGIFISQVGEDDNPDDPGAHYTRKIAEHALVEHLKQEGFERIEDYAEAHGGFMSVWKFKIAFKGDHVIERWHNNQATVDLELHDREMETVDGVQTPFRFFDGATMMTYQYPSRINQEIFCRDTPTPQLCEKGHGWDPERHNAHIQTLEVKQSNIPNAGRGVFAKERIPKGSYIAIDEGSHNILFMPSTVFWIRQFTTADIVNKWKMFDAYMFGYGFVSDYFGAPCYSVDASILTFLNHGCNNSNNVSPLEPFFVTEMTADPKKMPRELEYAPFELAVYNPFVRRNHWNFQHAGDVARRDIPAGEEILDSYLSYYTEHEWERAVLSLRAQCLSQGQGSVSEYEHATTS